jgi:conjugative transfer pilus assembly protein TraH
MKKMPAYSNNKELASFIMAVSGTLISRKEGDRFKLRFIKPKVNQKEFIAAYLKGGRTSQLVCNEKERCLVPRLMPVTIRDDPHGGHLGQSSNPCMKSKVYRKVMDIRTKYMAHEEFTSDEIDFLDDAVNLPVYRYIQVSAAAGTPFLIHDIVEFIAANVLLTQFDHVMSELIKAIGGLQKIYPEELAIEQFKESLHSARACVHEYLLVASSGSIHEFTQRLQNMEQAILSKTN